MHKSCGEAVDCILKTTALRKACDNLTVVIIAFDGFEKLMNMHLNATAVKEESILEVMLPPLVEEHDMLGLINDLSDLVNQAQY